MTQITDDLVDFYSADPNLGDIVFMKNNFEDVSIRGEVVGLERIAPNRGLNPDRTYEVVIYTGLLLKVAGIDLWLDTAEWEITDKLTGWEYKKLPPEVVGQGINQDEDDE